jgi:hypothetical protein
VTVQSRVSFGHSPGTDHRLARLSYMRVCSTECQVLECNGLDSRQLFRSGTEKWAQQRQPEPIAPFRGAVAGSRSEASCDCRSCLRFARRVER